jgi:sulfoacetaldehyde dehydrogenase
VCFYNNHNYKKQESTVATYLEITVSINTAEKHQDQIEGQAHQKVAEVSDLIERSRIAQAQIENYSQQQVDELITTMVWAVCRPGVAEKIAQFTLDETQLGNYEGKLLKISRKTRATLMDIIHDKSVGIIEQDKERNIIKIAKPMGVVGALIPCTNPEATPVIKSILAVKGRNSIVLAPHPRSQQTNKMICDILREAIKACGAPEDLVIAIESPTLERTEQLLAQCDRILATGGPAMVSAAYSSGTPALGVGAGNAVITVDDTADLKDAAEKIRISKTLDLAASCSADNSILAFASIHDQLLEDLQAQGGYLVSEEEKQKLQNVIWINGQINPDIVAQPALNMAKMAGFKLPQDKVFFIVPEIGAGKDFPFSGEKMSVAMAFYKVANIDEAIALTNKIQAYQGQGHSCGIYSYNDEHILKFGMNTKTSRVMVNQPQAPSNSGNLWNGMRQTFSLGCGSWGGNGTNNNITWKDLINVTWISKPLKVAKILPDDNELFGAVMNKL